MKKIDIIVALVIGELIALLGFGILKNVEVETKGLYLTTLIFLPLFCLFCLWIAELISKKFLIVWQTAKFLLVGVLNTFVDLGTLNLLIFISGIAAGLYYPIFKALSFSVALINSYLWNKFWTFKKETPKTQPLTDKTKEFSQFLAVTVVGAVINITVASIIVNVIGPQFGFSPKIWANVGAILATFCGMTWNFLGYKFVVFKVSK